MFTRSGGRGKKDGFKASLMTCTSDTVRTHLQRCRTLGEGLLKLCAHQSPYTGRTHRLFPSPQAASVRPGFEPTATPPSRVTSRGCYRSPIHHPTCARTYVHRYCACAALRANVAGQIGNRFSSAESAFLACIESDQLSQHYDDHTN